MRSELDAVNYTALRRFVAIALLTGIVFFSPPLFFIERYSLVAINKAAVLGLTGALLVILVRRLGFPASAVQLGYLVLAQATVLLPLPFLHQEFGHAFDGGYFNLSFQILASLAIFLILASSANVKLFARFWVHLHLLIGAGGLIVFIAGLVSNLEPLGTFSDRPYYDFGLAYTNVFYQVGSVKLIRIAGFYDEPGTYAFNITFALILARIYGMEFWKERLLILFGLTSLSMAFFVIAALWVLFALNRNQVVYILVGCMMLLFAYGRASNDVQDTVAAVTVDRFSIARSGGRLLKGDNRTAIMKDNYRAFVDSPMIGHGLHYEKYVSDIYPRTFIGNPVAPLATHGILGALLTNLHVFCFVVVLARTTNLRTGDKMLIGLSLAAILVQKPVTINGLGYLVFVVMTYRLLDRREANPAGERLLRGLVALDLPGATHRRAST